jgi:hypothetical protein
MRGTTQLVDVHLGSPLVDATEKQFLERLRRDLESRGIEARVYANLQVARQIDFLIVTATRAEVVELKRAGRDPIIGGINGRWERVVRGQRVGFPGDGNPYRQCHDAAYALGDAMRDYARSARAPQPPRGQFIRTLHPVVCLYPAIPEGSDIQRHEHVRAVGYSQLLDRLAQPGRHPDWNGHQWGAFAEHLHVYPERDDTDDARAARHDRNVTDEYCARFAAARVGYLPPIVDTSIHINDAASDRPDLPAVLLGGEDVTVVGETGHGKTLWAEHTVAELASRGHPAVWLEARDFGGDFATLLARAIAPYTAHPARELLGAAKRAGRSVVMVVDGLNECPEAFRGSLLMGVRALQIRDPSLTVLVTTQGAAPTVGDPGVQTIKLCQLDADEHRRVLAAYGAEQLANAVDAFASPLELSLAAACADGLPDHPSHADLFDIYIAKLHPTASARGALRAVAHRMHSELRLSLPAPEVARMLRRDLSLPDADIDAVLSRPLVRTHSDRIAFAHERFADFLAAEALLVRSADGSIAARELNEPRAAHLRRDAIALEGDEQRLTDLLSELHDPQLLAAAACGGLGSLAESVAQAVLVEALRVATARTLSAEVTFTPGEHSFGDSWEGPWSMSKADVCQLTAAGITIARGRLVAEVGQLLDATESVCAAWEKEYGRPGRTFAATYAAHGNGNHMPVTPLVRAVEYPATRNASADTAAALLSGANPPGPGRLYVACNLLRRAPHTPEALPLIVPLVAASLAERAYHLRLVALQVAQFWGRQLGDDQRDLLTSLVEGALSENMWLNSAVAETLSALGSIDSGRDVEQVLDELRDALSRPDDPIAWRQAKGAVSSIFEPADLVGPYDEAIIERLEPAERQRLFALALREFDSDDIAVTWLLGQLDDLDMPELHGAVLEFAKRIDPATWHSPQMGMESTVLTVSLLARAGVPRPRSVSSGREGEAWDAFLDLIESVATDRPAYEVEGRRRHLLSEHQSFVCDLLFQLNHATFRLTEDDVMGRLEDGIADAFGDDLQASLVWGLEHLDRLTSVVRFNQPRERMRYLITRLGKCGDSSAARVLRRFADDPYVGEAAANAVRQIESRSASI